nr:lipopolysaccharide biosynthesis protein [Prosthecomicrobium pneumaticum]
MALAAFVVRVASAAIAYLSQVLMARWIGDFEYGVFVVVWVAVVTLGGIACLGTQVAIIRFVPHYQETGEAALLRGVLRASRLQGLASATLFAALGILGIWLFGDRLASHYVLPLYLGAVCLPMLALAEIGSGVANGFSWSTLALWPTFIGRPLVLLAAMAGAIALGAPATAPTAMTAAVAATWLVTFAQNLAIEIRVRRAVPRGRRRYAPRLWATTIWPVFLAETFYGLLLNVDILVVGQMMAPEDAGVYYAAAKTLALVHIVYFAVRSATMPRFAQYFAAGDRPRLEGILRDGLIWTFWPSVLMVAGVLVAGRFLLGLFGPNFDAGYPLLFVLSLGVLARAAIGPAEAALTMAGRQKACAAIYSACFFLNLGLNLILVPRFGLAGAASATTATLAAEAILVYLAARLLIGLRSSIVDAMRGARLTTTAR